MDTASPRTRQSLVSASGWGADLSSHLTAIRVARHIGHGIVEGFPYLGLAETTIPKLGHEMVYGSRQQGHIRPRVALMELFKSFRKLLDRSHGLVLPQILRVVLVLLSHEPEYAAAS